MRGHLCDLLGRAAELFDGDGRVGDFAGLILSAHGDEFDGLRDLVDGGRRLFHGCGGLVGGGHQ